MRSWPADVAVVSQEPLDPDEIRRAAEDILSRGEFQESSPTVFDRIEEWLGELFGRIFAGGGSGPGAVIPWLIMVGLIAGTVWLVVRYAGPVSAAKRAAGADLTFGTEGHRSAEEWLAEAAALAAAGDYRGALRCRHQAMIAAWITDGRIDHVPGQTARECHRAARQPGPVDQATERLSESVADRFAAAWYGQQPVDARDYQRFVEDCTTLETALARMPEHILAGA